MLATAKHFAGYGGGTAGRDCNAVDLPPRLFRDVYLPPFKAVADAGIGSVMAAFNTPDGVPATSSRALLTGTLRDVWGRSEEHTSEPPSLIRTSYAVFCLTTKRKKKKLIDTN